MTKNRLQFRNLALGAFVYVSVLAFVQASPAFASEITPEAVIELVNKDRIAQGVPVLSENAALESAARAKADDMVRNDYFAHTSPGGVTPWYWFQQSRYSYRFAGENLAIHFTDAQDQEKAWMESVKHRENILNPKYQDIGVAVRQMVQDGRPTTIVVQLFGLQSGVVLAAQDTEPASDAPAAFKAEEKTMPSIPAAAPAVSSNPVESDLSRPFLASNDTMPSNVFAWFGFVTTMLLIGVGGAVAFSNRHVLRYGPFHRDHSVLHRV